MKYFFFFLLCTLAFVLCSLIAAALMYYGFMDIRGWLALHYGSAICASLLASALFKRFGHKGRQAVVLLSCTIFAALGLIILDGGAKNLNAFSIFSVIAVYMYVQLLSEWSSARKKG